MNRALVEYDAERKVWLVGSEFVAPVRGCELVVPKDRETDLASVPRLFWMVVPPFALTIEAAIVHDELYRHGGLISDRKRGCLTRFTRAESDAVFLELMWRYGTPWHRRWIAYAAVRCFGWSAWQGSR